MSKIATRAFLIGGVLSYPIIFSIQYHDLKTTQMTHWKKKIKSLRSEVQMFGRLPVYGDIIMSDLNKYECVLNNAEEYLTLPLWKQMSNRIPGIETPWNHTNLEIHGYRKKI